MKYTFNSLFRKENEYVIESDISLEEYDEFSISIRKVDEENKSFSYDNIDCVLKYGHKGKLDIQILELDQSNFDGFYLLVEKFKNRKCYSMGIPISLSISSKNNLINDKETLETIDEGLKKEFENFLKRTDVREALLKLFLANRNK